MPRRALTALTAATLVVAPTAAFGQESEPTTETVATTDEIGTEDEVGAGTGSGLGLLADLIEALSAILNPAGEDDTPAGDDTPAEDDTATGDETGDDPLASARETITQIMESILAGTQVATLVAESEEGIDEDDLDNELEEGADHGAIVSTVAHCTPNGQLAKTMVGGLSHGELVTMAARAGTVTVTVPTLTGEGLETALAGETTDVAHTLTSVAAAEAFCTDIGTLIAAKALSLGLPAGATAKDIRDAERDARKTERSEAKDAARAERDEAKAERADARATAKAERDEAKAERVDARAGAKAGRGKADDGG